MGRWVVRSGRQFPRKQAREIQCEEVTSEPKEDLCGRAEIFLSTYANSALLVL